MRIYAKTTVSNQIIPFNYQSYLTGAIHKWMGNNEEHGALSLYSFSWFQQVHATSTGIQLSNQSYFFISAFDDEIIKRLIAGIREDPAICFGAFVSDIQIMETPVFSGTEKFKVGSPVLIKRRTDNSADHITYDHPQCNDYLTETLQKKLKAADMPFENVRVKFDSTYSNPKTKIIHYKKIGNRVNICPVIIEGTPDQVAFAWNVGIGNSTGVGFGSLK
jgi:CRISPR-associated endoribonuclease Cas6